MGRDLKGLCRMIFLFWFLPFCHPKTSPSVIYNLTPFRKKNYFEFADIFKLKANTGMCPPCGENIPSKKFDRACSAAINPPGHTIGSNLPGLVGIRSRTADVGHTRESIHSTVSAYLLAG